MSKRSKITGLKSQYTKVPNKLRELGPILNKHERRIYPYAISAYLIFAGSGDNFNPSVRYICAELGFSKETVSKAIVFLCSRRLLVLLKSSRGKRDHFELPSPEEWDTSRKEEDSTVAAIGHQASCGIGHNNERLQMKEKMNDEMKGNSPFISFKKEGPKEEEAKGTDQSALAKQGTIGSTKPVAKAKIVNTFEEEIASWSEIFELTEDALRSKTFLQDYGRALCDAINQKKVKLTTRLRDLPKESYFTAFDNVARKRFSDTEANPKFRFNGPLHSTLRKTVDGIYENWEKAVQDWILWEKSEWLKLQFDISNILIDGKWVSSPVPVLKATLANKHGGRAFDGIDALSDIITIVDSQTTYDAKKSLLDLITHEIEPVMKKLFRDAESAPDSGSTACGSTVGQEVAPTILL